MKPLPRATNLIELVQSVYRLFEARARGKNLDYQLVTEAPNHGVMVDGVLLKMLVSNQLSNAITATERGTVRILLREMPDSHQEEYGRFVIEVSDTSAGMSQASENQLPNAFVQDNPVEFKAGGTQLSLCDSLARALNAHIHIDCQPGVGSRTTLIFEAPLTLALPQEIPRVLPLTQRLKVLVVQHYAPYRLLLCHQLEQLGHEAVPCNDSEAAVTAWRTAEPGLDLTMIDCNMPNMDGYETTRRIRKQEQQLGLCSHPIIGLVGSTGPQIMAQCLNAGMTRCLLKPPSLDNLMPVILEVALQHERQALAAATTSGGGLQEIKVLNPQAYRLLVDQILKSHREEAVKLVQLANKGDLRGLAKIAHKLLGGAQLADERALIEACKTLEVLTAKGSVPRCMAQVDVVLSGLQTLEDRLLQNR